MRSIWSSIVKVLKAYSLEESVLSVVLMIIFVFFSARSVFYLFGPNLVFSESGVYTEGIVSERPVIINPLFTDFAQANRDVTALVFSGLLKYDPKIGFVDDLASLKVSEDGKEYEFRMKDDVLWHDGEPVTVDDVMFTYSLIQNDLFQNPLLKTNFQGVKIEKLDDKTVKFSLENPNSFFITNLNVGILPQHLLSDVDISVLVSTPFNFEPVGSGPYRVSKAVEFKNDGSQRIVLEKFDDYFGVKPVIKEVRFNVYPSQELLVKDRHSLNIIPRLMEGSEELDNDSRFNKITYTLPQYVAVFFNMDKTLFQSDKLRIGLTKLINKDELLNEVGNKSRVDTPLMGLDQDLWLNKPDFDEANGALFDAGYKYKKDDEGNIMEGETYRRDKNGDELAIGLVVREFADGSDQKSEQQKTIDFLVNAWQKGGIKVDVSYLNEADYMTAVKTKDYDMILAGQNMGYNLDTFTYWHSSQAKEEGLNLSNFKSLAADQQIEKIRATFDKDDVEERQIILAEIIANDIPALFLYRTNNIMYTDGRVENMTLENLADESDRFVDIAKWCIAGSCK